MDAKPTQTALRTLTGVGAIFSASHRSRTGDLHGHSWEVTAWWDGKPDAMEMQRQLVSYLSFFDHTILSENIAWAEDLAAIIMQDMRCIRVELARPLERIYAVVERAHG